MCNIAGYVGEKEAAPILITMMRKEEGYSGGFYTGLATVGNGKIHMEKKTGDLQYLLDHTKAAALPGTVGIIHSRSKSGGGDAWAHPFLDGFHKEPELAYVANGYAGCCADRISEGIKVAQELLDEKCLLDSRITGVPGAYTDMPDGSSVHMSDVMCQVISRNVISGMEVDKAMDRAFCDVPSQVVGLAVHKDHADRIYFCRYDFPMFAAFSEHGAYLSSTPLAFPEDAGKIVPIPSCSCGCLTKDGLKLSPMSRPAFTVMEEDAKVLSDAYLAIEKALKEKTMDFPAVSHIVKDMMQGVDCGPYIHIAHEVLWSLCKQGRLEITADTVEGAMEGLTAPRTLLRIKE